MQKIEVILERGVEQVLPSRKGLSKLMNKKKIRLYNGIDPTASRLHLGHTIPLRKLQQFADLGHEVILLFGTGTVLAGDPSQRESARRKMTQEEIESNIKTWKKQVEPFLDFDKVKIKQNGDWLLKLTLADIIEIASNVSAAQLIKRDMFQKRLEKGDTVWTHEILYPLLQGYDSVVMDVDLEIGGTDQTFNMLIGRELQKKINNKEKYVITLKMICGTDGKQMSKSSGNCIWLDDNENDMFGKLMSIPDEQINSYVETLTELPLNLQKEAGPLEAKKKLAYDITKQIHGDEKAKAAQVKFEKTFQKGKPEFDTKIPLKENLLSTIAPFTPNTSLSEAKRYLTQGAIDVNSNTVTDPKYKLKIGDRIKIGAKTFGTVVKNKK